MQKINQNIKYTIKDAENNLKDIYSKIDDIEAVITKMLIDKFGLSISAYVIKVEELKDILSNSPN